MAKPTGGSIAKTKTVPYDVVEQLRTPEEISAYLTAWLQEAPDDAEEIARALADIARAHRLVQAAANPTDPVVDEHVGYWKKYVIRDSFIGMLYEDVRVAYEQQQNSDSQYARRTLIRTMFATVEGVTHTLKQAAIRAASENAKLYSFAEIGALREETFSVTRQGNARPAVKFVPVLENLMFAVNMITRGVSRSISFEEHIRSNGVDAFQAAVRVRNRIVHPRGLEDLEVSGEELANLISALDWFTMVILGCMAEVDLKEALNWLSLSLEQKDTNAGKRERSQRVSSM